MCVFTSRERHFTPENYLKFATHGAQQGDIALTSGNPGGTDREDTVAELAFQRDTTQPFLLTFLSELRGILTQYASKGPEQQAYLRAHCASVPENSLKAYKGRQLASGAWAVDGAEELHSKRAQFRKRVAQDPKLSAGRARRAWDAIASAVAHTTPDAVRATVPAGTLCGSSIATQLGGGPRAPSIDMPRRASSPTGSAWKNIRTPIFLRSNNRYSYSPAPIHAELEEALISWWLAKVREDLGTNDPGLYRPDG